ncbi:MAG: hypothetical protein ACXVXL_16220 [Solirubrobacteraceae bacterium]
MPDVHIAPKERFLMHPIRMLAVSGLLTLAAAAPAAADSIAYIKDSNIWLANSDGSHQVQVTHDGNATTPYRSPSQADDGTIAAGHGSEIVKLAQSGRVLAHFAPPTATDSTGQVIADVPQQIAISPDGAHIAYVYSQPSCPPGAPCGVRQELLYSYSDRTTPLSTFGEQTGLTNPSWIDNSRVLAFGGHFRQVNVDSPGAATGTTRTHDLPRQRRRRRIGARGRVLHRHGRHTRRAVVVAGRHEARIPGRGRNRGPSASTGRRRRLSGREQQHRDHPRRHRTRLGTGRDRIGRRDLRGSR